MVIEQALEQGHSFLLKHQSDIYSSRDDNDLVARVTSNLQNQLDHVESQWQELMRNSEKWQSNLSSVLDVSLFFFLTSNYYSLVSVCNFVFDKIMLIFVYAHSD